MVVENMAVDNALEQLLEIKTVLGVNLSPECNIGKFVSLSKIHGLVRYFVCADSCDSEAVP